MVTGDESDVSHCGDLFDDSEEAAARAAVDRIPRGPGDYAARSYWQRRYSQERGRLYDWYNVSYDEFWECHLARLGRGWGPVRLVLEVGCGNSTWSARTATDGFFIISTDIDAGVLEACGTLMESDGVERVAADARRLPFREGVMDLVFEKGTLDALSCGVAPRGATSPPRSTTYCRVGPAAPPYWRLRTTVGHKPWPWHPGCGLPRPVICTWEDSVSIKLPLEAAEGAWAGPVGPPTDVAAAVWRVLAPGASWIIVSSRSFRDVLQDVSPHTVTSWGWEHELWPFEPNQGGAVSMQLEAVKGVSQL